MTPALDIYDPKNPNFVNPNDVLLTQPNDTAAQLASMRMDVVVATTLRSVQAQVAQHNVNLRIVYLDAFNNWLSNRTGPAPTPPNAWVVGWFKDPTSFNADDPNVTQWPYPVAGNTPLCAQPPIPDAAGVVTIPNHIHVGNNLDGDWWSAPADDTLARGKSTPPMLSDDGVMGVWQKYTTAFAPNGGGYYLLLRRVGV